MIILNKIKIAILMLGIFLLLTISVYTIGWKLPISVSRYSDIKFGNEMIRKVKEYRKQHGLPETNDWQLLRKLGFKQRGDLLIPDYQKLNDTTFELVYLEGFDGPYLIWNSAEKHWKMAMLTHFQ